MKDPYQRRYSSVGSIGSSSQSSESDEGNFQETQGSSHSLPPLIPSPEIDVSLTVPPPTYTTLTAAILNTSNAILGGGVIALPYCMKLVGLFFGIYLLIFVSIVAKYAYWLLHKCCTRTNQASYGQVALYHLGPRVAIFVMFLQVIYPFGVITAYHIIIKQNMESIIVDLIGSDSVISADIVLVLIDIFIILPCCLLPYIDSLKQISGLVIMCAVFIVFVVFGKAMDSNVVTSTNWEEIRKVNLSSDLFVALPVIVFSFNCSSQFISIYSELRPPTSDAVARRLIVFPLVSSLWLYVLMAIFGYIQFGDDVEANILSSYVDDNNTLITVSRFCYSIAMSFSVPIVFQPLRNSLERLVSLWNHADPVRHLELSLNHADGQNIVINHDLPFRFIEAASVLALSSIVAIFTPSLIRVFALTGAVGASTLCYTLPGLMYLKTMPKVPWNMKLAPVALTVFGIFTCISCVVVTMLSIAGVIKASD